MKHTSQIWLSFARHQPGRCIKSADKSLLPGLCASPGWSLARRGTRSGRPNIGWASVEIANASCCDACDTCDSHKKRAGLVSRESRMSQGEKASWQRISAPVAAKIRVGLLSGGIIGGLDKNRIVEIHAYSNR